MSGLAGSGRHEHCWHDTDPQKDASNGEPWIEVCCYCGSKRTGRLVARRPQGHGPYLPEVATELRQEYSEPTATKR